MALRDLNLTHLVGLNLGNGNPTKGMIEIDESHPRYPSNNGNLRRLYESVSEGWFIRDVYDVYGITTCATTVWARESFAVGRCLTYRNTTGSFTTYKLSCNSDSLRVDYYSDKGCTNHQSVDTKYYLFDCMNSCTASTSLPLPSGHWSVRSFYNNSHGCSGPVDSFVAVKNNYCTYVLSPHQAYAHTFMLKFPVVYHYNSIDCTGASNITLSTTLNTQCAAVFSHNQSFNYQYTGDGLYDDYIYIDQKNLTNMLPHSQWGEHIHVVKSLIGMRIGIAAGVIAFIVCCLCGCIRWYRSRDKVRVYSDPTAEAAAKVAAEKAAEEKRRFRGVRKNRGVGGGGPKVLKEEQGARVEKKCCSLCC